MNDEISSKLLNFLNTMNERAEKFPISIEEIKKEVEEVRSSNHREKIIGQAEEEIKK